jgi:hypothetical protein
MSAAEQQAIIIGILVIAIVVALLTLLLERYR